MPINLSIFDVDDKQKAMVIDQFEGEYLFKLSFKNKSLNINTPKYEKDTEGTAVFIQSTINKEILKQLRKLEVISTMPTGYDHIDLETCKKKALQFVMCLHTEIIQ